MEKVINTYENLFIVSLANGESAAKETVNKFTTLIANNAEIVEVAEWGKRRLAYLVDVVEYLFIVGNMTVSEFFDVVGRSSTELLENVSKFRLKQREQLLSSLT